MFKEIIIIFSENHMKLVVSSELQFYKSKKFVYCLNICQVSKEHSCLMELACCILTKKSDRLKALEIFIT
jgi:hypothetical protein